MREIQVAHKRGVGYYLLVESILFEGTLLGESYGVKLVSDSGEEEKVLRVTVNAERVQRLLQLLVENEVTPVALQDVVQDWL